MLTTTGIITPPCAGTGREAAGSGSVYLAEADRIPEGLFLRSEVNLARGLSEPEEIMPAFLALLRGQLAPLDLDLALRLK